MENKKILMSNFSQDFNFKICQKFKINQPKIINCSVLGDFCLAYFKFLRDLNLKFDEKLAVKLCIN
jgi:hypothetical protein